MAIGQESTSRTAAGSSDTWPLPGSQTCVTLDSYLWGLLPYHWMYPWLGRTGTGPWLRGTGTESQGYFWSTARVDVCRHYSQGMDALVPWQVPEMPGLFPDQGWEGLEPSYRAIAGSLVRPKLASLPPGAKVGMSPSHFLGGLNCLWTTVGRGWSQYRSILGSAVGVRLAGLCFEVLTGRLPRKTLGQQDYSWTRTGKYQSRA